MITANLKPQKVFEYFEKICSVPHGSGNTKQISDLLAGFARDLGLKYRQDELNNLIVWKDASPDKQGCAPVILQGHMDMVCTKEAWVDKDMAKDGLDLVIDGDWLKANGTSLGGDDGIAVAIAFAILEDNSLSHPPIEVVITVDEEVGMDGAFGIDLSDVKGRRMMNIDSEEEGVVTVSCAGGVRADSVIPAQLMQLDEGYSVFKLTADGLLGGHSGCEIDKGRGNAIKLMSRILFGAEERFEGLRLCSIKGGRFDNVICPECEAVVAVHAPAADELKKYVNGFRDILKNEYAAADPGVELKIEPAEADKAYDESDSFKVAEALFMLPQGVIEMSRDFKDLPQTSLNLGVISSDADGVHYSNSIRSSITSQKEYVLARVRAVTETEGGTLTTRGTYPGWAYNRDSAFRATLMDVYKKQTGREAAIAATHGGLECGLFIEKLPGLDCLSIGPDMRDIHSSAEKLNIPSVARLYDLITGFLAELR